MFRHEACSSSDVAAAAKATKSHAKLSVDNYVENKPEAVASPAVARREAPKDYSLKPGDERSQDILGLRKYEKQNRAKSRGATER